MTVPLSMLASLPPGEPDPARSRRVRQRCQTALVRGAARRHRPAAARRPRRPMAWPAAIACLGALYVAEVLSLAARILGTR